MTESVAPTADDPLWSTAKIAVYFDVKESTVLRWINDKEIEGNKINNRWKVLQSEVHRFRDKKYEVKK